MDFVLFKEIVNECSRYGARSFSLHLFGEPLLYPKIREAIEYIKAKNRRHTILLTTNGTILNKYAKFLQGTVDRVIWSYRKNNFDEESIRLLRRKGLIRLLIEETPKEEFEKWSKFPRVEIKHLHNYGGNIDVSKWGLSKDIQQLRYPCYHLWLAPAIRWNGDITICCNDPNGKESFGKYSNVFNLRSFWSSDRLLRIRESHKRGDYKGLCVNCDSWKAYPNIFWGHEFTQKV